jgi:hypothetical protein
MPDRRRTDSRSSQLEVPLKPEHNPSTCTHRHWTRSVEKFAEYAICTNCGERLFLCGNWAPELTDSEVSDLWLKKLPRSTTDE